MAPRSTPIDEGKYRRAQRFEQKKAHNDREADCSDPVEIQPWKFEILPGDGSYEDLDSDVRDLED